MNKQMSGYYGSGKLLLFGEHSAVYGYPAVGMPLESGVFLKAGGKTGNGKNRPELVLSPALRPHRDSVYDFIDFVRSEYPDTESALARKFVLRTSLPAGAGLGSSAAFCTAFARYLLAQAPDAVGAEYIWRLSNSLEQFFHGRASGIDTGLACSSVPLAFYFAGGELPETRELPAPDFPIVYGTLEREQKTSELVTMIKNRMKSDREKVSAVMEQLGKISENCISCLEDSSISGVSRAERTGEYASVAHRLLAEIGLSTPLLDEVVSAGLEAGSCGGKLSGAGGGGAFWFAAEDLPGARRIRKKIRRLTGRAVHIIPPS